MKICTERLYNKRPEKMTSWCWGIRMFSASTSDVLIIVHMQWNNSISVKNNRDLLSMTETKLKHKTAAWPTWGNFCFLCSGCLGKLELPEGNNFAKLFNWCLLFLWTEMNKCFLCLFSIKGISAKTHIVFVFHLFSYHLVV